MDSTRIRSWSAFLVEGAVSRRSFLHGAAGTAGGLLGAGLLSPIRARADDDCVLPKPVPGTLPANLLGPGIPPFPVHDSVGLADQGADGTNITDFIGEIGSALVKGCCKTPLLGAGNPAAWVRIHTSPLPWATGLAGSCGRPGSPCAARRPSAIQPRRTDAWWTRRKSLS